MFFAVALTIAATGGPLAQADGADVQQNTPIEIEESAPVTPQRFDGDVRDLPQPQAWKPGDSIKEVPRRYYPKPGMVEQRDPETSDSLVPKQQQASQDQEQGTGTFTTPSRSFNGIGFTGVNPPDPTGAVGPNHYIQSINGGSGARVRIFDKAEPTPNQLADFAMESLGSGGCASGLGDPVVIYDRAADRFVMTEFQSGGNNLCVYIAQTSDPVAGGWFAYSFTAPSFPDYPKYGTWSTDMNEGAGSYVATANDGGPGIYAMDRGNMLAGNAATSIRVTIPGLSGFGFEAPTPADLDGPQGPPPGAPAIIMRHRDTEVHNGPSAPGDILEMWTFDIDWVNTNNSVLTQQTSIDVAEFDSSLCGLTSFNCFPQPGTGTTLDPLREVIMNRLQYMHHFDGTETLVGSYVVDIDGANTGGVRWFELRGGTPNWTLHQEGTYSIDSDNRFMSSISMDQSMNVGLAYNVSSSSQHPSLRYTGRLVDDPLGTMSQAESIIFDGTASNGSNRYGDYSHMSLDPADDCTFWFTGEANASSSWLTQIASFRFEACGCDLFPETPTLTAVNNGDNRVDLQWDDSDLTTVVEYRVLRSRTPGGPYERIATIPDSSPGVGDDLGYAYSDFTVDGGIDYYYVVRGSDGQACTSPASNEENVTATGVCNLTPLFNGLAGVSAPLFGVCTLDLAWAPATPECGGGVTYNVYRSTTSSFTPNGGNLLAGGLTSTVLSDINQLVDGQFYFYIVRAVDVSNGKEDNNLVVGAGEPDGVGGATCATGSACADNPFVDVNPEGPLTRCQNDGPTLTADISSGNGPFTYQWMRDGAPIPGATSEAFTPNDLGVRRYNARVSSVSCPDEVFDGLDTTIERVNAPFFGGLDSAVNPEVSDCTVDLQWSAASTVCGGPISYTVFRDTTTPVAATYDNLIAGGLTGTSYVDTNALADSQTYHYIVRAFDHSTLQYDSNAVVRSITPDGPFNGLQDAYFEDFSASSLPAGWNVTTGPGPHNCGEWGIAGGSGSRPSGGSGNYLIADNRCAPLLPRTSTTATSPAIDLVIGGVQSVELRMNIRFDYSAANTVETGTIEVWDGAQWVQLWASSQSDANGSLAFDVTPYALNNPAFRVRFDYQNATTDNYFSVDNLRVVTDVLSVCATAPAGPPSVPRDSLTTTRNGAGIDLTWDASCGASNYNLLFGDLANVSSYTLDGSVCGLGTGGSFSWTSLPSGNIFFLLVGTDGAGTESSWGQGTGLGERNGNGASGECGASAKEAANICF
jgi:hypothetical protein